MANLEFRIASLISSEIVSPISIVSSSLNVSSTLPTSALCKWLTMPLRVSFPRKLRNTSYRFLSLGEAADESI